MARGFEPQQTRSHAPVHSQSLGRDAKLHCTNYSEVSKTGIKNLTMQKEIYETSGPQSGDREECCFL
jgi:hypothetical protein